ncbi:MAG: OmpA family protein [Prevotellaceae bacterium]|nr:OmpA family protein [Prevotellaceae bacterium]
MKKNRKLKIIISLIALMLCFVQAGFAGFRIFPFSQNRKTDPHRENCKFHRNSLYMPYTLASLEYTPVSGVSIMHNVDIDGDGVPNRFDNCPATFGIASMNGCPPVDHTKSITYGNPTVNLKAEDFDMMVKIFSSLEFEGEQLLNRESQNQLNSLVKFLKKEKRLYLYISSYVNAGSNRMQNYYISESRVLSVRNYLVKNGVESHRIGTLFFGDMMPVVDLPATRFEVEICDKMK